VKYQQPWVKIGYHQRPITRAGGENRIITTRAGGDNPLLLLIPASISKIK
jgi:hypothetical protein